MKMNESNASIWSGPARRVVGLAWLAMGLGMLPGSLWAALVMDMPEMTLPAHQAGLSFEMWVQNDGAALEVTGIGFNIQVADGGPLAGGSISGPAITGVDIFTGTIFTANNNGLSGTGSIVPQVYERGTLTLAGPVSVPNGWSKVATVTLDTSGFSGGTFSLTLDTRNGPTKYTTMAGEYYPTLIDGSVTLVAVPEPDGWGWIGGMALLAYAGLRKVWGYRLSHA